MEIGNLQTCASFSYNGRELVTSSFLHEIKKVLSFIVKHSEILGRGGLGRS